MKNTPNPLAKKLQAVDTARMQFASLNTRLTDTQAQLADISLNGDLESDKVLNRAGRLQILIGLLPGRIAASEPLVVQAEAELLTACHEFISQVAGPRLREVVAATKAKVKGELQKHFGDPIRLEQAVDSSSQVREISDLNFTLTIRQVESAGLFTYATNLLACLDKIEAAAARL
jgi:hypothetical protein